MATLILEKSQYEVTLKDQLKRSQLEKVERFIYEHCNIKVGDAGKGLSDLDIPMSALLESHEKTILFVIESVKKGAEKKNVTRELLDELKDDFYEDYLILQAKVNEIVDKSREALKEVKK